MAFSHGKKDSQFYIWLLAQAAECDLNNLGTNQLLAQLLMSKSPDPILKDEYLKMDRELTNIVKTFQAYETQMSSVGISAVGTGLNALVSRSQGSSSGNGCSFCGRANCRSRPSCPATDVACNNCQKLGHYAHVLPAEANMPSHNQTISAASTTNRWQERQEEGDRVQEVQGPLATPLSSRRRWTHHL
jgi:hypothetical protein